MANMADITVYDGAATPVAHVLKTVSVSRKDDVIEATWRENLASVPVYAQVTLTMRLSRLKSGVYRVESKVEVPVMEAISGQNAAGYTAAPKIAYVNTVNTVGLFHERSDANGRRLVRQMANNINGNISTSVTPAVTGPLPDLFDLLVAPT